jgi:mRNA interferase MazF
MNVMMQITSWSTKKASIATNVPLNPSKENGLSKKSVADCLQTRPIDRRKRLRGVRGKLSSERLRQIDQALGIVFQLE